MSKHVKKGKKIKTTKKLFWTKLTVAMTQLFEAKREGQSKISDLLQIWGQCYKTFLSVICEFSH